MKKNSLILVFGITGDLSKRKLIPGLYKLVADGELQNARLVGAAYEAKTKDEVLASAKPFIKDLDPEIWQQLIDKFTYCQVDINNAADFAELAQVISNERKAYDLANQTLVYCAVFELLYTKLTEQLAQANIISRMKGSVARWCRIVYEKPFGHGYDSVHKLNKSILRYLNEDQVYRIDHYLAKEVVENIAFVRFTNRIFEPLWNNFHIEQVQITLDESIDIEGRGSYYEKYGIVKDVVQNHILQLMALVAMDAPRTLTGSAMQDAKAHVLKKITCEDGLFGQYDGYLAEEGVAKNSRVPTFAALRLVVDDERWQGVPFYIKTGKVMPTKKTNIVIKFKSTHCLLTKNCPTASNYLTISIYPEGGFDLQVNAKKPGASDEVIPVKMNSCYESLFEAQAPRAYENLISEIMSGETSFAVRLDEIESAWQVSDQIENMGLSFYQYTKGSDGPKELADFNKKYNLVWK
jgi:glucose-6-phosphate 1-dehydrogenase